MNTGQTMLTLAALALLSTITVNMTRSFFTSGQMILRSKCGLAAVSVATSFIEEASGKYFDAETNDTVAVTTSMLTPANSLGPSSSEKYPNFNDFDDYNNYSAKLFFQLPDTFYVSCKVMYIDPATPNVASSVQTWHKKLLVKVTSPTLKDTIKSEYIYSYWYFR